VASHEGFRLRPGLELIECSVAVTHDERTDDLSEEWVNKVHWLIDEVMMLRKRLRRYGDHLLLCEARGNPLRKCSCGFQEVLAMLEESCDV
jgi:hypothetical protein